MDDRALGGRAPIAATLRARHVAERSGRVVLRAQARARALGGGDAELWVDLLVNGQRVAAQGPLYWDTGVFALDLVHELVLEPGQSVDLLVMSGSARALPCGMELDIEGVGSVAPAPPAWRRAGDVISA